MKEAINVWHEPALCSVWGQRCTLAVCLQLTALGNDEKIHRAEGKRGRYTKTGRREGGEGGGGGREVGKK